MKKRYSVFSRRMILLSTLAILAGSHQAFSQSSCGSVLENFNNTAGGTNGFAGGDFVFDNSTPPDGRLFLSNAIGTAIYTINTPTFQLPTTATTLGYGFTLGGTVQVAQVNVAVMYISTFTNQMTTISLGQFTPSHAGNVSDNCRSLLLTALPGFPSGGRYRFRFEFVASSGSGASAETISFDDFRTNGVLAQSPLPVNFISFEAKKTANTVQLTWKVAGEENVDRYEVEKSPDGHTFTTIGKVAHSGKDAYTYSDAASSNTTYYRIKNVDNDRKYKYSTVVRIANGKSETVVRAFPQPAQNHLTVQHPTITAQAVLTLSSADGRLVRSLVPAVGSMQTYLDISNLERGIYLLRFDGGEGKVQTMKVVKQ